MYLFPLVMRELRTAPRRVSTWRIRFIVALISSAIILLFAGMGTVGGTGRNAGASVFWFMSGLLFFFCLVEGWRHSADCLSEEKREGTLGLLMLTDLGPLDVILGKLATFALNSVSVIAAAVPGITLAVLLGGVTFGEVGRVAQACLVALAVSMSVGVCVSAGEFEERKAMLKAAAGLLALLVGPLFFNDLLPENAENWAFLFDPLVLGFSSADAEYVKRPESFRIPACGCSAMSLGLILRAAFLLNKRWNIEASPKELAAAQMQKRRFHWLFRRFSSVELGAALRASAPLWLLKRTALGEFRYGTMLLIVILSWASWAGFRLLTGSGLTIWNPVSLIVGVLLVIAVCAMGIRPFSFLRKSGMAEILLTTPFELEELVANQRQVISGYYSRTIASIILVDLLSVGLYSTLDSGFSTSSLNLTGTFVFAELILALVLAVLARSMTDLAMWMAITERKEGRALMKTLFWCVGPILLFGIVPCCGLIGALVVVIHLGSWSARMLRTDLREVIVDRLNVSVHESTFLPYGYLKSKPRKPPAIRRRGPASPGT